MTSKTIPITGAVLEWAILDRAASLGFIADSVEVSVSVLQAWMDEDEQPTEKQLKKIAKELGRPVSFFFLEEPPSRSHISAEFRRFTGSNDRTTQQALNAIGLARRVQKTHAWTRRKLGEHPVALPVLRAADDVEDAAQSLRHWLAWETDRQTSSSESEASVARSMRNALQAKGIIALNLSLDGDVTRGFSLHHEWAPLVAVNTKDPQPARLFSYVHELVHLCLGEDAVCETADTRSGVERFCNRTAAALLMPEQEFLSFVSRRFGGQPISTLQQVGALKNNFRVSYRAAAVRAEELGIAVPGVYGRVDATSTVDQKTGTTRPPEREVRDRPRIRVDQYGHEFVSTLFRAEAAGYLRRHQLADLLRVSDGELSSVKKRLSSISTDG